LTVDDTQKKGRSLSDRSAAIGCLAEIIAGMKAAITPFTQPLLELFYHALSDPDAEVQSNAAFAVGMLVESSEQDLSPQYLPLLGALRPLFNVNPDASSARLNARDNASGAVARFILKNTNDSEPHPYKATIPGTSVSFEMLPIPEGDFVMGTPKHKDESPPHKVHISPF